MQPVWTQLSVGGNVWAALSAVATLLYVIVSALLWRESIHANRQAENAHKEALRAFEFNRELWRAVYRPFIAAQPEIEEKLGQVVFTTTIRNTSQSVEAYLGPARITATVTGAIDFRKVQEAHPTILVPREKLIVTLGMRPHDGDKAITEQIRRSVIEGSSHLDIEISVPYVGLGGQP